MTQATTTNKQVPSGWLVLAFFICVYYALALYGLYVSGAEDKTDEIQQQHEREHGL